MRKWTRFGAAAVFALTLCAVFGNILITYSRPMENAVYDLSLNWTGEAIPDGWIYDQKGWTVFTQEGAETAELTPDGTGGFTGLSEPGQTFYFSRVIEEDLASPTLRLGAADRMFSVFLDGTLIYTDCPDLDNRIGHLRLPMLGWDREEALLVALPLDCAGKTLTVAQSTSPFEENYRRVWPCAVTLYCGYAYESALISESFQTAIPSALSYAAGLAMLGLFLLLAFQGRLDPGTLCGALASFYYLAACISQPSFHSLYFDIPPIDVMRLSWHLSLLTLLAMVLCKLSGRRRAVLGVAMAGLGVVTVADLILSVLQNSGHPVLISYPQISSSLTEEWLSYLGIAGLLLALAFGFGEWRRRRWFFRPFCLLTLAGTVLYAVPTVLYIHPTTWNPLVILRPLLGVFTLAAFLSTVVEWVHGELARRTEARLLAQRSELAQSSYDVLRQQNEQVMMLRHDMMKHFQLLRQTTSDERTAAYLDELIGQNEKIRPVVQSGNEMLDIILNGKLSAAGSGITVELTRTQAPDRLPLSDTELCSLVMNLLDNALEAAAAPGVKRRYIRLALHIQNNFFVFTCENGATLDWISQETAPGHGLGLKVVRQIMERHGNLLNTEYGDDYYKVTVLLPLCQPLK